MSFKTKTEVWEELEALSETLIHWAKAHNVVSNINLSKSAHDKGYHKGIADALELASQKADSLAWDLKLKAPGVEALKQRTEAGE